MKVRKFNEDYNIDSDFNEQKSYIIEELNEFKDNYEIFTKMVSSKNWRSTGTHFTQLRQMIQDIQRFSEITTVDNDYLNK